MEKYGKRPFFRAAMAGLGKYHTGGYGRIGVYRVNQDTTRRISGKRVLLEILNDFEFLKGPKRQHSGQMIQDIQN